MKRVIILLLFCPVFWFLITHLSTAFHEWAKTPAYLHQGISSLFSIDKIRYSVELNRDTPVTRVFYNKVSYFIGVAFSSLSLASPRNLFIGSDFEPILIIFLPFFFIGLYKIIEDKNVWWFIFLFVTGFLIYLTGQTSPYFIIFLVPFYLYAICKSL